MGLFGPGQGEIWKRLSLDIEGKFIVEGQYLKTYRVIKNFKEWNIELSKWKSGGRGSVTYTRIKAIFYNEIGFQFKICRGQGLGCFEDFFSMKDIIVPYNNLNNYYKIKSNSEECMRKFLDNERIRELINIQEEIKFEINDSSAYGGEYINQERSFLLIFVPGVIKDNEELKELFELMGEALLQIDKIKKDYEKVELKAVSKFDVIKSSVKKAVQNHISTEKIKTQIKDSIYNYKNNNNKQRETIPVNKSEFTESNNSSEKGEEIIEEINGENVLSNETSKESIKTEKLEIDVNDLNVDVDDLSINVDDLNIDIHDLEIKQNKYNCNEKEKEQKRSYENKGDHVDF